MYSIRGLPELQVQDLRPLADVARSEGYTFLDKLLTELDNGEARFNDAGEKLCGMFVGDFLVAIGGVHSDPYQRDKGVARLRRVFIAPSWRRQGIGRDLVRSLIDHARLRFHTVRLRVPDENAAKFYEALGFARVDADDATHIKRL